MPLYDYLCADCGPFEARADVSAAGDGTGCPGCGSGAERTFSPPGGRVPRRQRQLQGFSGPALHRLDRAQAGVASVGGLPAGTNLDRGGKPRRPRARPDQQRPWQLGH